MEKPLYEISVYAPDRKHRFMISGFDSHSNFRLYFEKIETQLGRVVDMLSEDEVGYVLSHIDSKTAAKIDKSVITRQYYQAREDNFFNITTLHGGDYTLLNMKKDGKLYRCVMGADYMNGGVNGRDMNDDERHELFCYAFRTLGEGCIEHFELDKYLPRGMKRCVCLGQKKCTRLCDSMRERALVRT